MSGEEQALRTLQRERTARVKRILRWMPRRATMHRYPVLKWFAGSARRRPYLWTFRTTEVVPALYTGCILAFLPLYGVQVPIAVLLAFLFRANLPVLVSLQWITNPLTAVPIYYTAYHIGRLSLTLIGVSTPSLNVHEVRLIFNGTSDGGWVDNVRYFAAIFGTMSLGGAMIGSFVATLASILYRFGAREAAMTFRKLQEIQEKRRLAQEAADDEPQLHINFPERRSPSSSP